MHRLARRLLASRGRPLVGLALLLVAALVPGTLGAAEGERVGILRSHAMA